MMPDNVCKLQVTEKSTQRRNETVKLDLKMPYDKIDKKIKNIVLVNICDRFKHVIMKIENRKKNEAIRLWVPKSLTS